MYYLETIVAAEVCPNIVIELSSLMPHHIVEVLANVPDSRLIAGSDIPASLSAEMGKILDLPVEDEVKRRILWENACRLFDGA